jgi:hypothetical protein
MENTPGYTQAELDAFNAELASYLSGAAWGGTLSEEDTRTIITSHNEAVARRERKAGSDTRPGGTFP